MERGSAVGTAGVRTVESKEVDEYIGEDCHRVFRSVVLPPLTALPTSSIAQLLTTLLLIIFITTVAVSNRVRMSPMNATTRVTQ
eukprot:354056-Amphidinium_carterae.1